MNQASLSLYLQIPFCRARCTYCDFNTHAGLRRLFGPYVDALDREARQLSSPFLTTVRTIFLVGGTPTALPIGLLRRLLASCQTVFEVQDGAEITCEANPGTLPPKCLHALRSPGLNRLSLGAQTFNPRELALLGRIHDAEQVAATVRQARAAGFDNLNLDLIYGLPGHRLCSWQHTLEQTLELAPQHISHYGLTLKDGTPLHERVQQGEIPAPDPDTAADMYEFAGDRLAGAGYQQCEISNWSLPGYECAHNLAYWHN